MASYQFNVSVLKAALSLVIITVDVTFDFIVGISFW